MKPSGDRLFQSLTARARGLIQDDGLAPGAE